MEALEGILGREKRFLLLRRMYKLSTYFPVPGFHLFYLSRRRGAWPDSRSHFLPYYHMSIGNGNNVRNGCGGNLS